MTYGKYPEPKSIYIYPRPKSISFIFQTILFTYQTKIYNFKIERVQNTHNVSIQIQKTKFILTFKSKAINQKCTLFALINIQFIILL